MTDRSSTPEPLDAQMEAEAERLLAFAEASRDPEGGFGWLDSSGRLDPDRPVQTWVTARMTYVFALAHLRGQPGAGELADVGVAALAGFLRDDEHGGWFPEDPRTGTEQEKKAYDHAFVALAAATAALAERPGARELLDDVLDCFETRFWDADAGLSVDLWNRDWTELEPYRGANANMHLVETFLVVAEATGDPRWRDRALGIAERLIHVNARDNDWRVPEHFDPDWSVLPDYNRETPAHPFRPYGATIGHWFEWARLLGQLHTAFPEPPQWLLPDAQALFAAGLREGWAVDGQDGFVYTVDWDGAPVVRERMHWVVTEAIGAACVLGALCEGDYEAWLRTWWTYARRVLIDPRQGSWHAELGPDNTPSATVWEGKPDVYHSYQAMLLCLLPPAPTVAGALRQPPS